MIAGGHARSTPSRWPTSSTRSCSVTAKRSVRDQRSGDRGQAAKDLSRAERLVQLASDRGRLRPVASTRPSTCPTAASAGPSLAIPAPPRVMGGPFSISDAYPYPKRPLVPLTEVVHERLSVEVFRGCVRGCRFCQAGMITRPVRERSKETSRRSSPTEWPRRPSRGRSAVALVGRSLRDPRWSRASPTATRARTRRSHCRPRASTPSTSGSPMSLTRNGRRTGLTFAPEAGTERMRKVINKTVSHEDMVRTANGGVHRRMAPPEALLHVRAADRARRGHRRHRRDGRKVGQVGLAAGKRRSRVDGIVRRVRSETSHTVPVVRAGHASRRLDRKLKLLRASVKCKRVTVRGHGGWDAEIEGFLSRGDRQDRRGYRGSVATRRPFRSVERALPARSVAGSRPNDLDVDIPWYTTRASRRSRGSSVGSPLRGCREGLAVADWERAQNEIDFEDCRWSPCTDCGTHDLGTTADCHEIAEGKIPLPLVVGPR